MYAELQVTTNYSFLRGASHPKELFAQAKLLGLPALGITDRNSLAGIVRAHQCAEEAGVHMLVGCRLDLTDGISLLVYPQDRPAYSRLCRLLSTGKKRAGKGACDLAWADVGAHGEGMLAVLLPDQPDAALRGTLARLRADFRDRAYLALTIRRRPGDAVRLRRLAEMAASARIATVATGDVLYHVPERHVLQDVLTCIREGCTIDDVGFRRERFADRYLRAPGEMTRLFERHLDAAARTLEIVERCPFNLRELRYQYPSEIEDPSLNAQLKLARFRGVFVR
jgi:error-prone DNA polymerase